jgi:hypothetical protein
MPLRHLYQLRTRLPGVPALLKLRLSFRQGRHPVRARHGTCDRHRPEPAETVGTAAGLVDAALNRVSLKDEDGLWLFCGIV